MNRLAAAENKGGDRDEFFNKPPRPKLRLFLKGPHFGGVEFDDAVAVGCNGGIAAVGVFTVFVLTHCATEGLWPDERG